MQLKMLIAMFIVLVIFTDQFPPVKPDGYFRRNGEPLNINWVTSLPWDVANTLRAPLGAPLSLILTSCLALIMFFGMAVSPVYYLLGTPKRKYNLRDAVIDRFSLTKKEDVRLFPNNATIIKALNTTTDTYARDWSSYPNFLESFFWLLGEEDRHCQKLMVCHAHGFFNFLPKNHLKYYRVFSSKVVGVPKEFQRAIKVGLDDQSLCMKKYFKKCPKGLVNISKQTFQNIVPSDLSEFSKLLMDFWGWLH